MGIFFPAAPAADRRVARVIAPAAAALGLALGGQVQEAGLVGEVAVAWSPARPQALIALDPPVGAERPAAGGEAAVHLGPLRWGPTRPTLRLAGAPLLVNAYTGGIPDVPAATAARLGATEAQLRWGARAMGAALVLALAAVLHRARAPLAAGAAALLLATRWDMQAYRALLGGTELALLGGVIALIAALCAEGAAARRWICLALAVGLHAKITFLGSAAALLAGGAAAGALPRGWPRAAALGAAIGLAPDLLGAALELGPGRALPLVPSHDRLGLQLGRVAGALTGAGADPRAGLGALWAWLTDPTSFLAAAYGAPAPAAAPTPAALGALGWAAAIGAALRPGRAPSSPAGRLQRALRIALPLQLVLLWVFARDLHHLAQSGPTAAAWSGLALAGAARAAGRGRWIALALLCAPAALAGGLALHQTDAVLRAAPAPTVSASGQRAVVDLLRTAGARRVIVCDYEAWGSIDRLAPEIALEHAWPAAARGEPDMTAALLRAATGDHLLTLRASAPFIYNWRPDAQTLYAAAAREGLVIERVGALPAGNAELWAVRRP